MKLYNNKQLIFSLAKNVDLLDSMLLNHYNRRHSIMENQKNMFQLLHNVSHLQLIVKKNTGIVGDTKSKLFKLLFRNQMNDFHDGAENLDINNELQSLITALEREGIKLEKQEQSKILINELYTLIDATPDQIGHGCLHLYSMETFLYPQLNQFLREADHTKVEIYGSFVRLLCFYFNHSSSIEVHGIEVYRGMNLSSSVIDAYEEAAKSGTSYRWTGFSSTSKSRQFVKDFNTNTLFIMQLKKIYSREKKAIDISGYSQFPEEEEVLLKAGVEFTVEKVNYDNEKEKYYIYLNVYV